MKWFLLAVAFIVIGALTVSLMHPVFTPDYIVRVLVRQDSNTDDHHWKNTIQIAAPLASATGDSPTTDSYPDSANVRRIFESIESINHLDEYLETTGTRALIVTRNGQRLAEFYANGGGPLVLEPAFSVSKSVLALIAGRAIEADSSLHITSLLGELVPELAGRDERFGDITLANLLDMRAGLAWSSSTPFPFVNADSPQVYYASNLEQVLLTRTHVEQDPGSFEYIDYNPNLVALAIDRSKAPSPTELLRAFWIDLGSESNARWTADNHEFPYWESGLIATGRDLARIGQLLLDGGKSGSGKSIVSHDWLTRTLEPATTTPQEQYNGRQWAYRNGWWQVLRPDQRNDIVAIGRFGQMIYVSPRNQTVIVRLGLDRSPPSDVDLTEIFFQVSDALGG